MRLRLSEIARHGYWLVAAGMACQAVGAEQTEPGKPLWEIGIAAFGLSIPQYMGDEERYTLPLAAPYLIYRGEFLRADRDGIRGILLHKQHLSLDLGFSFDLPVSNDNEAREGMPELYLTGQVGPRINWRFDTPEDAPEMSLHLPVRYTIDTRGNALGWLVEPSMKLEQEDIGREQRVSLRFDLGALFASEAYNDYYYSVEPQYATAERPVYDADGGLHSLFAKFNAGYRMSDDLTLRLYLIARTLSPGVIADSPLVKDELYLGGGIGFVWRLWQSQERVRNH
jgi:outer membrane scaffolding protein for murein synthesis (MipA/OmpV family)